MERTEDQQYLQSRDEKVITQSLLRGKGVVDAMDVRLEVPAATSMKGEEVQECTWKYVYDEVCV